MEQSLRDPVGGCRGSSIFAAQYSSFSYRKRYRPRPRVRIIASLEYTRIANDSFRSSGGIDCYLLVHSASLAPLIEQIIGRRMHARKRRAKLTMRTLWHYLLCSNLQGESLLVIMARLSSERRAMAVRLADSSLFGLNDLWLPFRAWRVTPPLFARAMKNALS